MIVVFTAARLVLVAFGLPRTRIPVFLTPSPSGSIPRSPDGPARSPDGRYSARPADAQPSRQMPEAREGDPRNHRARTFESVQVTLDYVAHLGQGTRRQGACDKGQFRI
jgi:hypothetical protein